MAGVTSIDVDKRSFPLSITITIADIATTSASTASVIISVSGVRPVLLLKKPLHVPTVLEAKADSGLKIVATGLQSHLTPLLWESHLEHLQTEGGGRTSAASTSAPAVASAAAASTRVTPAVAAPTTVTRPTAGVRASTTGTTGTTGTSAATAAVL